MFPLIPLFALAAILGGSGVMWWYMNLSEAEQEKANRLTAEYARELFNKTVDQLTVGEAKRVHALVKQHFDN